MKTSLLLCVPLLMVFLTSCASPRFQREWKAAVEEMEVPPTTIEGPWSGEWQSGYNQHSGDLKSIVTALPEEDAYRFHYWASWGRFMRGTFVFEGQAEDAGEKTLISGSRRLGPIVYNHEAELTPERFDANFGSDKKDFGTMNLTRPE